MNPAPRPASLSMEPLESRRLMARPFTDTAWGDGGMTTLGFDGPGGVYLTRLAVAASGESYVLARTESTVQVAKFTAAGAVDPTWFPKQHGLLKLADSSGTEHIAVDSAGRVVVLAGDAIYRYSPRGDVDRKFGVKGRLGLDGSASGIDVTLDAADRIYVTKTYNDPSAATVGFAGFGRQRMLVERFTPRGKFDVTFGNRGRVTVPLPRELTATQTAEQSTEGQVLRVLPGASATNVADDKIVVAAQVTVSDTADRRRGMSYGAQGVRLNVDGSLDRTYGRRGIAYVAGTPYRPDATIATRKWDSPHVLPNGSIATVRRDDVGDEGAAMGLVGDDVSIALTVNRGAPLPLRLYGLDHTTPTADGGFLAVDLAVGVVRYTAGNMISGAFNGGRASLKRFADDIIVASIRNPNDLLATTLNYGSDVFVTLFTPQIDPLASEDEAGRSA